MVLGQGAVRRGYIAVWMVLVVAVVVPTAVRLVMWDADTPRITIVRVDGEIRVALDELKALPMVSRTGDAQNQFGNWREGGMYTGVLLADLLSSLGEEVRDVRVVATDGYSIALEAWRILDPEYPVVLAYAMDGVEIPDWEDGPRLVVLPEDGAVSNEEYGAESAGSFWVKNVDQIVLGD